MKLLALPLLEAVDFLGSNFLLPIAGLLVALMMGRRFAGRTIIADADYPAGRLRSGCGPLEPLCRCP